MTKIVKTVIDRIEGDLFVCSDDDTGKARQLIRAGYPHFCVNDVLLLTLDGDKILSAVRLDDETATRKKKADERLRRLFDN